MNDASEFQLAALGFDWQTNQASLVNTYYAYSNGAGLYTPTQVQAMNVSTPLIQRSPTTGSFTLTIGVEKSTDLITFTPFPMSPAQLLVNARGELEFQFTAPDSIAFFQLRTQ